jgi:hypothetical protein
MTFTSKMLVLFDIFFPLNFSSLRCFNIYLRKVNTYIIVKNISLHRSILSNLLFQFFKNNVKSCAVVSYCDAFT